MAFRTETPRRDAPRPHAGDGQQPRAVWTADCSATVELSRLAGPRSGWWRVPAHLTHDTGAAVVWNLGLPDLKAALYERCLAVGTPFDIYAWVNADDLADLWPRLVLPGGMKAEWAGALRAAGHRIVLGRGPDSSSLRGPELAVGRINARVAITAADAKNRRMSRFGPITLGVPRQRVPS